MNDIIDVELETKYGERLYIVPYSVNWKELDKLQWFIYPRDSTPYASEVIRGYRGKDLLSKYWYIVKKSIGNILGSYLEDLYNLFFSTDFSDSNSKQYTLLS